MTHYTTPLALDVSDPMATFNEFLFSWCPIETWDTYRHSYSMLTPKANLPTNGSADERLLAYLCSLHDAVSPSLTPEACMWAKMAGWGYGDPLDPSDTRGIFAVNQWYVPVVAVLRIEDDALQLSAHYECNDRGIDDDAIRQLFASL